MNFDDRLDRIEDNLRKQFEKVYDRFDDISQEIKSIPPQCARNDERIAGLERSRKTVFRTLFAFFVAILGVIGSYISGLLKYHTMFIIFIIFLCGCLSGTEPVSNTAMDAVQKTTEAFSPMVDAVKVICPIAVDALEKSGTDPEAAKEVRDQCNRAWGAIKAAQALQETVVTLAGGEPCYGNGCEE